MNIIWIDDESIVRHCKPSGSVGSGWCFNETRSTTCSQMLHERMKTTGFARLGSSFTWHGAEGPHVCAQQPTNHTTPSHTPHWAPKHFCSLFNFTWDLVSELVQKTTGNVPGRANPVFVQQLQAACSKPTISCRNELGQHYRLWPMQSESQVKSIPQAFAKSIQSRSGTNPLGCK